ncbi:hypothetical protein MRB53_029743 [Persea americana]|uniref:Uncharacterized protein n=1 Tax=Persea americana TaxID=3435 RepID=A0ACC2KJ70_PERAE|nr:hypothetical protein MRB53_029743 [Persea americana]
MTPQSRSLAALTALILMFLLSSSLSISHESMSLRDGQARRLRIQKPHSQTLKNLQGDAKKPDKQTDASFRRIPPSVPNPTQNKSKPRSKG